jgi:hypothetical protein
LTITLFVVLADADLCKVLGAGGGSDEAGIVGII